MITTGPTLQRRGQTVFSNGALPTGGTDVVTTVANTAGIIVRSCLLITPNAGGSVYLMAGGINLCGVAHPTGIEVFSYIGPGLLVPPGIALQISALAGSQASITYDLL